MIASNKQNHDPIEHPCATKVVDRCSDRRVNMSGAEIQYAFVMTNTLAELN